MNVARQMATATKFNGYICVAGGCIGVEDSGMAILSNSIELYDPQNDEWTQPAPMNNPRSIFALFELNGFLYAMGTHEVIEKYEPAENSWTEVRALNMNSKRFCANTSKM